MITLDTVCARSSVLYCHRFIKFQERYMCLDMYWPDGDWTFRSQDVSFPGTKNKFWTFRSLDVSFPYAVLSIHWRQPRRECRRHIPTNILVGGGRQWEYPPPQYYYVLSDIADQY